MSIERDLIEPVSNSLPTKAVAVLDAIATLAAAGPRGRPVLAISQDWGYGTATLTLADGSHTHVGGDCEETREANLTQFVNGLHASLVQGSGLSWIPTTDTNPAAPSTSHHDPH